MAESKNYPPKSQPKQGGFLYNYDIVEVERDGETFYQYESVWVKKLVRDEIVPAIIRTRYSVNDEFALNALDKTDPDYIAYREFVGYAKEISKSVI
jgi:hypothetical protein